MSIEKFVIEITSQHVTWRDLKIEQLSYLMALEQVIENLTDACAPGQEIAKTLHELKEHETQIILRGPKAHLQCALLHLHTLYGEDLGALALAQGQELSSSLFVLDPTEGLTSDVSSQLMAAAEESALKTFILANEALEQLKQIQSIPDPTAGLQDELEQLRAEFEKSVIKVLVYGGTAAGKSTYLNALLGGDYLPTNTRDVCTGSLIYLKYTTDEPCFEVYWRDQRPVTRSSDLGELPTYTDETAPQTQADEVSEVHVYLPLPLLKHLQLIDAPGSRDGDERRQALLDQALSKVDAFLYLLPLERGTQDYKQDLTRLEERSELSEARAYVFTKADAVTGSSLEQLEHRRRDVGVTMPATLCAAKPLLDLTQGLTSGTSIEELIYQVMPALRSLHQLDYKQSRRLEDALHHLPQALILSYVRESCWVESGLHMVTAPLLMKRLESLQGRVKRLVLHKCIDIKVILEKELEKQVNLSTELSSAIINMSRDVSELTSMLQEDYLNTEKKKAHEIINRARLNIPELSMFIFDDNDFEKMDIFRESIKAEIKGLDELTFSNWDDFFNFPPYLSFVIFMPLGLDRLFAKQAIIKGINRWLSEIEDKFTREASMRRRLTYYQTAEKLDKTRLDFDEHTNEIECLNKACADVSSILLKLEYSQ